jgi:hypothetical protein
MNVHDAWVKAERNNGAISRSAWRVDDEAILCLYHGMDNIVREFFKGKSEYGDMFTAIHTFCVADLKADDWEVVYLTSYHNEKREKLSNELIENNGGWETGYEYAYCSSDGKIYLSQFKPEFDENEEVWRLASGLFLKFKWGEGLRCDASEDYSKIIVEKLKDKPTEGNE